jgi:hypothetical protein
MILPRVEGLRVELPRSAIELSMNDEMIDWADSAFAEDAVPAGEPAEFEVPAASALIRL